MSENRLINTDPIMYTDTAGEYLNIHPRTLNNWVQKKKYIELLRPFYCGSKLAFKKSSLENFIQGRSVSVIGRMVSTKKTNKKTKNAAT